MDDLLALVRTTADALPHVTCKISHGRPTWFVKGKSFLVLHAEGQAGRGVMLAGRGDGRPGAGRGMGSGGGQVGHGGPMLPPVARHRPRPAA